MKKILFAFSIALLFFSCNKYPDGPAFSMYSKSHRIENIWIIDKVYDITNGAKTDITDSYVSTYQGLLFTIAKQNLYSMSCTFANSIAYTEDGEWDFNRGKTHVLFSRTGGSALGEDWTILKLKEKQLWESTVQSNGSVFEIHFIPRYKQ